MSYKRKNNIIIRYFCTNISPEANGEFFKTETETMS